MKIPTDPIEAVIFLANLGLMAFSVDESLEKLATGIAATAEGEGREVTDAEMDIIKRARDAAADRRRGTTQAATPPPAQDTTPGG